MDDEQAIREQNGGYLYAEAFCLMQYSTTDGREVEYIWNSRDGVTPFIVPSRTGREMRHVDWHQDRRLPNYEPQIGARIFVDLTPMRARIIAAETVAKYWDDSEYPMRERYSSPEEAMRVLIADMLRQPGEPDLIEVRP